MKYIAFLSLFFSTNYIFALAPKPKIEIARPSEQLEHGYTWKCYRDVQLWTKTLNFCFIWHPQSNNRTLTYFFHPFGYNEDFVHKGKYNGLYIGNEIRNNWSIYNAPPVVSISYQLPLFKSILHKIAPDLDIPPLFILANRNFPPLSGMYENFTRQAMPYIEDEFYKTTKKTVRDRQLSAISMGGMSAIILAAKNPTQFKRVALFCPAIVDFGPYSSFAQLDAYKDRTPNPSLELIDGLYWGGRAFFGYQSDWNNSSPLELANRSFNSRSPEMLISYNSQDWIGFAPPTREFIKRIQSKGLKPIVNEVGGGHCDNGREVLPNFANFLEK